MKLKMCKTQIWSPDPRAVLPPEFAECAQYRVPKLKAVGSTLAYTNHDVDTDWRGVPLTDFAAPEDLDARGLAPAGGAG
eukprot:9459740-Pyramimonas_sp.AAC.1